jgi:hypothetical protein
MNEALKHVARVRAFYDAHMGQDKIKNGKTETKEERAYKKCLRAFPEGIFRGYTYPDKTKNEKYVLDGVTNNNGADPALDVTCNETADNSTASDSSDSDLGSQVHLPRKS